MKKTYTMSLRCVAYYAYEFECEAENQEEAQKIGNKYLDDLDIDHMDIVETDTFIDDIYEENTGDN